MPLIYIPILGIPDPLTTDHSARPKTFHIVHFLPPWLLFFCQRTPGIACHIPFWALQTMLVQYIRLSSLSNIMICLQFIDLQLIVSHFHKDPFLIPSFFQELQSEVSSLLEFKNALLNEFPHLHHKISNLGVGHPAPQDERRRSTLGLVGRLYQNTCSEFHFMIYFAGYKK